MAERSKLAIGLLGAALAALVLVPNVVIARSYDNLIFNTIDTVPVKNVALVLGTSREANGRINPYYRARIVAAYELYANGKVKSLLLSGDNSRRDYNEPQQMKDDLLLLGVKEEDIFLDYAGFRTLDSIVRAKEVFGLTEFVIVSQGFHCERALFIAEQYGISAIGYAAPDVQRPARYRVLAREFFARAQAGLDVWVTGRGPRYLGDEIRVVD